MFSKVYAEPEGSVLFWREDYRLRSFCASGFYNIFSKYPISFVCRKFTCRWPDTICCWLYGGGILIIQVNVMIGNDLYVPSDNPILSRIWQTFDWMKLATNITFPENVHHVFNRVGVFRDSLLVLLDDSTLASHDLEPAFCLWNSHSLHH